MDLNAVIACDRAPGIFEQAIAVRGVLEAFGIRVMLYQFTKKPELIDFLAGNYPDCDYAIWFCYGSPGDNGEDRLEFQVADREDDDYTSKSGWKRATFILTPSTVSQYVRNPKGTLICGATSGESWAESFLAAGYKGFIAPHQADVACYSEILFITGFFYHLLIHQLDYTDIRLTAKESAIAAAAMDEHYEYGTRLFRYYEPEN